MSARPDVLLIDTGLANLASIEAAFGRLGASVARMCNPSASSRCSTFILLAMSVISARAAAASRGRPSAPPMARKEASRAACWRGPLGV